MTLGRLAHLSSTEQPSIRVTRRHQADIIIDYENIEQMRAQEEQAQEEQLMNNYDFDLGDWIY